ncbi:MULTISPECIES: TonB-dependent receptor [unclassified Sphingopyxis]|uniref:TonB-dependent receptor n=1 Tax=unclassified Sphingopyxis TaxID=2614943 RepID=UPI00072FDE48|nr:MULTISPECIES: TonB-dependent receptor [unclassified Sphingopyxis]KTE23160.1 TonB-dependent receptor [Sphingopyxis sp. H057]KTE48499.1 TonB-dependent receptor [Sphingopyxis sp. H073]KTE50098.1 TonB-dependent receptor [Sphingopyxis sp. H071]KTE58495.1 TonB-dependent receptor [Sphingopyxis sp. H107]KTE63194.1 TonB-dependent receptor [Sphingopyxis sp. H100]
MKTSSASFLALSCVGSLISAPALATEADAAQDAPGGRTDIVVTGRLATEVESPKSTAPLVDTPQTITVVTQEALRQQNLLTLRDALATIPGITFGAGEGGGGYGDSINLRGYSANNDLTVDGVRDSAQYSRTDPFNLQQIEVYNGANSVFNGSGSVGGTINLVSKIPFSRSATTVQAAVGTDNYYRASVDSNWRLNDLIAVRLNAMYHENDVPGRDVESYQRWGVAPSITIGVDSDTSLTLAYIHQDDDNTPIYGVPFFLSGVNDGPLPGVDDSDYFGIVNLDAQKTKVNRLTATFRHAFSENVSIRNLTRWQRVHQYSQTSAPQGVFCLANGLQPVGSGPTSTIGIACPAGRNTPGTYYPSGPRGLVRDQVNDLLHNQTDLTVVTGETGGTRNTLVIGASISREDYEITTASLARNPDGSAVTLPPINLFNPDTTYTGPINFTVTARSKGRSNNKAIYAFDTLELGTMFELNAGLRYESNRAEFRNIPLLVVPPGTTALTPAQREPQISDENLFSYRFGAVFHPIENVSFYGAYGNARTPSSATVRLGCGVIPATGAADPCAVAPEKARTYEIGAKAELANKKLLLTAALFRNERTNFRTPSNDPSLPNSLQVLDGESRVDGVAIGVTGNLTPEWAIFANYTYLDSKVKQSVSDFCLTSPGATGCSNSVAIPDPQAGDRLIQTPKHSGSLFTTYAFPFGLQIGYGLTYQGRFATNQRNLLQRTQFMVDDYLIHRAFVSYDFNNGLVAQLNVTNLTNEDYYTGVRNNVNATTGVVTGGWATPGDARSAVFSLFYTF